MREMVNKTKKRMLLFFVRKKINEIRDQKTNRIYILEESAHGNE